MLNFDAIISFDVVSIANFSRSVFARVGSKLFEFQAHNKNTVCGTTAGLAPGAGRAGANRDFG